MLFLGEQLSRHRVIAVVTGFLGVLVILRPGVEAVQLAALVVLGAAFFFGRVIAVVTGFLGVLVILRPGVEAVQLAALVVLGAAFFRWRHRFLAAVRQAPDRLAGIVEADETFVLESRKGERKLDRKPRRRGGKARKRGLSREQVPILVAADRAGATLSHTLPALNAKSVKEALEPVVARDALLVSDANRCYPPVAAALGIPHESINGAAGERGSRRPAHPDGQQPPQPDQGLPAGLPRHRHQVPRQLSQVVPSHRTRRSAIAQSVSQGGDGQTMPTFR